MLTFFLPLIFSFPRVSHLKEEGASAVVPHTFLFSSALCLSRLLQRALEAPGSGLPRLPTGESDRRFLDYFFRFLARIFGFCYTSVLDFSLSWRPDACYSSLDLVFSVFASSIMKSAAIGMSRLRSGCEADLASSLLESFSS